MSYIDLTPSGNWFYGLEAKGYKRLIINTIPENAIVTFTATGKVPYGDKGVWVPTGTTVNYSVSALGYDTTTGSYVADDNHEESVVLGVIQVTLTVTASLQDATVTLVSGDSTETGTGTASITVDYGSEVTYTVSKTGYDDITNSVEVTADRTINVTLSGYTLTVNVSPSTIDYLLTIEATGYEQSGNEITVPSGTSVTYKVSALGYNTQINTVTVTSDNTINVTLTEAVSFVLVGAGGAVATSVDGSTWNTTTEGTSAWKAVMNDQVTYESDGVIKSGRYWMVGNSTMHSSDGSTWTDANVSSGNGITYSNGIYMIAMNSSVNIGLEAANHSSITWSSKSVSGATWLGVSNGYVNNSDYWVVAGAPTNSGNSIVIATSTDNGQNWTTRKVQASAKCITYGYNEFVVGCLSSVVITSSNGVTWSPANVSNANWNGVVYGDGTYVLVGQKGSSAKNAAYKGSSESSWHITVLDTYDTIWNSVTYGIVHGVGYFVAVGNSGKVAISNDGINWTVSTVGSANWNGVAILNS